jgi:hypothetical protein
MAIKPSGLAQIGNPMLDFSIDHSAGTAEARLIVITAISIISFRYTDLT